MRPEEKDPGCLWDMREAAERIVEFTAEMPFSSFVADPRTVFAVERLLTIIGEAARQVSEQFRREHPEYPWRQMIGPRNLLTHQYNDVVDAVVWKIATGDVPVLIERINNAGVPDC